MLRLSVFRLISRVRSNFRRISQPGKPGLFAIFLAFTMFSQIQAQPGSVVDYTAPDTYHGAGTTFTVPITFDDHGFGLVSFQFDILFDPTIVNPSGTNFGCSTSGTIPGTVGTTVLCNVDAADPGRLRLSSLGFATFTTGPDGSGPGPLVNLTFTAEPTALPGDISPLVFDADFFFNNLGPIETQNPTDGQVFILGPTAADVIVSGRAQTASGRAIGQAILTIEDSKGNQSSTRTNPLGYYQFSVQAGGTYVIRIFSKGHTFKQSVQIVQVADSVGDINFVASD